ncbi:NB-ARC domain-containing protein [Daejeonella rubra]|uniref:NB-ARC domain-containing protein n=1 Tax=Daejeonella rubra TaxID=990371 RepID=A0A1G9MB75_9SPHI|nr:NB-ARC domain-containing protein [Daejeonella rubra]SDL70915.1 NB-ARC domain-containing protein [Daejeonella rubra]
MILPIKRINERVEIAKQDSDTSLFFNLMYAGEQLLKLITVSMVSGIKDSKGNKDNDQYSQYYELVHADSIGVWSNVLDNILTGPAYHFLLDQYRPFWSELMEKSTNPSWQYGSLTALNNCLKVLNERHEDLPTKYALKNWFKLFVQLRNDARAHGVINAVEIAKICPNLETSIKLISDNFSLFKVNWVYIKQNISGSYRTTNLNEGEKQELLGEAANNLVLKDGVYLILDEPHHINVLYSTVEATDFYFPNGNFTEKSYECLSYITGKKLYQDSTQFLKLPGQLPSSETEGKGKLDLIHTTFTNLPFVQSIYINRSELESELETVLLLDDTYPIITLNGRGGIGKTSLTLFLLRKICKTDRFDAIIWLSARDIDLLEEGPKIVKPQILDETDIGNEFTSLLEPSGFLTKGYNSRKFIEDELRNSGPGTNGRILVVMDNFETLKNPTQVYKWLVTHVRNPNKILITSRLRDFKADYPITVQGMNRQEFNELVERVSIELDIQKLLNKRFLDELYSESDGHPYVVKVMLGEVSIHKELRNVKRVIAGKDEILTALFERTYSNLSISSKRVFLTLCSWRNIFPEIAIEAVLKREDNELINVEDGIEELFRYSFIELIKSNFDDSDFISVPLAAFEFGRKKLSVNPLKSKILLDIQILQFFGVTQFTDINKGLRPKVEQFFKNIAISIRKDNSLISKYLPLLEFVCRKYPEGWKLLSNLYYELNNLPSSIDALQKYLADHRPDVKSKIRAWEFLSKLYALNKDYTGEAHSLTEMSKIDEVDFNDLSNAINSLNNLFKEQKTKFKKEEIYILLISVAEKMNNRIKMGEGSPSNYTNLAWVYINLSKKDTAKTLVKRALEKEPTHFHALNLAKVLKIDIRPYYAD